MRTRPKSEPKPARLRSQRPATPYRRAARLASIVCLAALLQAPVAALAQTPGDDTLEAGVVEDEQEGAGAPSPDDGLPSVALATFTTGISEREPVDNISFLENDRRLVYFFTDLRHMQGKTIRHVWTYRGEEMGSVSFEVKGARWRAWSSKQLLPDWLGAWTVSVLSPDGVVLATETFTYQEAP